MRILAALSLIAALLAFPLAARNSNEKILRIRKLAKTDSQSIPELTQDLSDPDDDVRLEAVKAIVKIGSERSLDPLAQACSDKDPDIQILATDGLVNFYLPGYVPSGTLLHPFKSGAKQMRAIFSVRNRQEVEPDVTVRPSVGDAIAAEIAHGSSIDVQTNAARAAGILHDQAAVPPLEEALHSRNTPLVLESMYALQKIDDPSAGPAVNFLVRDFDEKVQLTALETVGVLRNTASAEAVRDVYKNSRNERVRRAAFATMALLGEPAGHSAFKANAGNSDDALRVPALEGLGRIREPEDTPLLTAAFNEKDAGWKVHAAAAFGLVNEGDISTGEFSPLRFLVQNLDATHRDNTAASYIKELAQREDVRKGLYAILPGASPDQQIEICRALGSTGAPDAIATLQQMSKNEDSNVALAATKALTVAQMRRPQ